MTVLTPLLGENLTSENDGLVQGLHFENHLLRSYGYREVSGRWLEFQNPECPSYNLADAKTTLPWVITKGLHLYL